MILSRGYRKRSQPKPLRTGLLLIHQNIGRAARMLNGASYRLRSRGAFRPFGLDIDHSCTRQRGRIGDMIGADPAGHHHDRIGHYSPIGLIGQFDGGIQRGIQGKGAQQIPLLPVLGLVHRHRLVPPA